MLSERLTQQGSLALFQDVEMPLLPVLADIERNGFLLDVEGLQGLSKGLERELDQMVGPFIGSPGVIQYRPPSSWPRSCSRILG